MPPRVDAAAAALAVLLLCGGGAEGSGGGRMFSLPDYGGRPGPGGNNTAAFARAVHACEAAGGGTLRVPAGTWVSGGIRLVSHMTLRLEQGATIQGITPPTPGHIAVDYPVYNGSSTGVRGPQSLVLADGCINVTIDGPGILDGNGAQFWIWANLWPGYDYNNKSDPPTPMAGRPSVLRVINSTDVVWRGFTVLRSPFWATQIIASKHVLVDGVRIHVNDSNYCPSPGGPCYQPTNEDGLDIAASQHVVVRHSEIYSHDDSIALLAGAGWWPDHNDLFNVTVENNTLTSEQAAIALDTAWGCGSCRISDVVVRNCRVGLPGWQPSLAGAPASMQQDGSMNRSAMAGAHPPPCQLRKLPWESPYGCLWPMTGQVVHARGGPGSNGSIANVIVSDIEAGDVMMAIFLGMCLGYDPAAPCPNATAHVPAQTKLPSFSNMTFRRIHTRYAAERFIDLFGIAGHEQISGIVFEDLSVEDVGLVNGGHVVRCEGARVKEAVRVMAGGQAVDGPENCWAAAVAM